MQCAQRGTNAECSVPYGAQILNAEFEMLNEKKKEKVGMENKNLRSTRRGGSYAKTPAPKSKNASLSIQHSAFSIGATAPRVPHSALAQQAALTPAPQSENASFSIQHSAFSIGATAPRIQHSEFSTSATAPPPAPQSDHSAFSIQHSAFGDVSPVVDIHHHLVWGMDADGPQTPEDSINMLRAAAADGITCVIATPHVMPGIAPFDGERFRQRLAALQSWCRDQGQGLRLYPGAEIFYTPMTVQYLNEGRVPTMNGTAYVLVEFDPGERYEQIRKACAELTAHGYIPILAHTERYTALVRHPKAALALREELGLAFQVNCGTIINPKGFWQQRFIKSLLKEGALDHIATDSHNITTRPVRMKEAITALARYGADSNTILQHSADMVNGEAVGKQW